MPENPLLAIAQAKAATHRLDAALVCAVVEQESDWNPWAIRYEPAFLAGYVAKLVTGGKIHDPTEEMARAFSWGLMQVMGEVAREAGYAGHLARLCEPETGLEIGCRVLAAKLAESRGDVRRGLQLWNGGADPAYADQVLARAAAYAHPSGGPAAGDPVSKT